MNVTELVAQHAKGLRRVEDLTEAVEVLDKRPYESSRGESTAIAIIRSVRDDAVAEHNRFCAQTVVLYDVSSCDPEAVQQFLADLDRLTRDGAK